MFATWERKVLFGLAVVGLLLFGFFMWPGPAIREAVAKPVPVAQPVQSVPVVVTVVVKFEQPAPPAPQATPVPAAVQPQPAAPVIVAGWNPYDSAGGIPYNGTSWNVDVAPDELEVFTAGPASIAGVNLPGGIDRGSIIILLPGLEVVHYEVTGVIPGSNWHGSYRPLSGDPAGEATWRALANDRVAAMQTSPNCTPGKGCTVIDVLVVGPDNKIVAQWVVNK